MSEADTQAPSASEKAVKAEIEAGLTAFDEHKEKLLDPLRKVYEYGQKNKPFDEDKAWRSLKFAAYVYLRREVEISQEQAMMPAGERAKMLRRLGSALRVARRTADEAMETVGGRWFVVWAGASWQSRLLGPHHRPLWRTSLTKGSRAWLSWKRPPSGLLRRFVGKRGDRPEAQFYRTTSSSASNRAYRDITKRNAGAGPGPFARFVQRIFDRAGTRHARQQSSD